MQIASATINALASRTPINNGFSGVSMEYGDRQNWTGKVDDHGNINYTFVQLFKNLTRGSGAPSIRVGGNSTDLSVYEPDPLVTTRPAGIQTLIREAHLAVLKEVARLTTSRLIPGVNFGRASVEQSLVELENFNRVLNTSVSHYELGNEPDLYGINGTRPRGYAYSQYKTEIQARIDAIKAATASGRLNFTPKLMIPGFSQGSWMANHIADMVTTFSADLSSFSYHRYPLNACGLASRPIDDHPTIAQLLSPESSEIYVSRIADIMRQIPSSDNCQFTELNSVACGGMPGVSNSFASALWGLDILFELASRRVRGVNIHIGTDASYTPFTFKGSDPTNARFDARIQPLYYAMYAFALLTENSARLIPVVTNTTQNLKAWATIDPVSGKIQVAIINKDNVAGDVSINIANKNAVQADLYYLTAPSVNELGDRRIDGVDIKGSTSIAGQKFDSKGVLQGDLTVDTIASVDNTFNVTIQPYEVVILSIQ